MLVDMMQLLFSIDFLSNFGIFFNACVENVVVV
jgi:hypothetical protein